MAPFLKVWRQAQRQRSRARLLTVGHRAASLFAGWVVGWLGGLGAAPPTNHPTTQPPNHLTTDQPLTTRSRPRRLLTEQFLHGSVQLPVDEAVELVADHALGI